MNKKEALKATNKEIEITKKVLENNYSPSDGKFLPSHIGGELASPSFP